MRINWRATIGLSVSALLLWWVFRGEDLAAIGGRLAAADPLWLTASGVLVTSGGVIGAVRWRLLLEPLYEATTFRDRWAALNIGFMVTNVLPARLGELARPFALSRMTSVSMSGAFGTVVVERLFDIATLLVLLLAAVLSPSFPDDATVAGRSVGDAAVGAVVIVALALAVVGLLVAWPRVFSRAVGALAAVLPPRVGERMTGSAASFLSGLESVRRPGLMAKAFAWSLLLWVWWAAAFWAGFRAFDIDLGLTAALFTQCAVAIFIALPSAPGFIGAMEAGVSVSLEEVFGVAAEPALSLAVGYHLAGLVPVTLIGFWYASRLGLRVGQLESEAKAAMDEG